MRDDPPAGKNPLQIPAEQWGPGYRLWQAVVAALAQRGPEGTTSLVRVASHLVVILVAVLVLWFSRVQLPRLELVSVQQPEAAAIETEQELALAGTEASTDTGALVREAVPFTLIPERPRTEVVVHSVVAGDTLYALAQKYGLRAETLIWANNMELNPDLLRLGQKLTILPINGVYHTVVAKDTIEGIAKQYKAKPADIIAYKGNNLDPKNPVITVGQKLIVPGGSKPMPQKLVRIYSGPVPANASKGTGRFVWPTSGRITQSFKPYHRAIDIAGWTGAQIKAADSGYVVESGWSNEGYGNYIVIDHRNGFQTLYGHLSRLFVNAGESVGKGALIGLMGTTGNSTGPHLHFEIRQSGVQINPFGRLP
jgi:murein DD-endopeptidase MepM/ murein hydrolase activator NlpD